MLEKNLVLLWSEIRKRLSPTDFKKIISLLLYFNCRKINKSHTIDSALLLLEKDDYLYRRFAERIQRTNISQGEQEDEEGETQNGEIREDHLRGDEIRVEVDENPKEDSLSGDQEDEDGETRDRDRDYEVTDVEEGESREDHLRDPKIGDEKANLYEIRVEVDEDSKGDSLHGRDQEDEDGESRNSEVTDIEESEIGEVHRRETKIEDGANHLDIEVEVDENQQEDFLDGDQKNEDEANHLEVRVRVDENPKEDSFTEMNLEGKKRKRASRRLEQATPSYKLIFEEEQCLASDTVLNNKYIPKEIDGEWRPKKLSGYEEVMAKCEDDMYEVDMLMRALRNAVESAEKVMRGDMRLEDVGVKFYRCVKLLYDGDMAVSEAMRENQQEALPVILGRLKQKLNELEFARERWKPIWKKVFEENTAKQRDWDAQGRRRK